MLLMSMLTLVLLATAYVGRANFEERQANQHRYQQLVAEQFDTQPDRHPHRVSHYGYLVFRPPAPLGFLDEGIEGFTGTTLFLEAHRQNAASFSRASQTGAVDRVSTLSVATVLQMCVPLLVLALSGVAITREREQGTLPLALCQGATIADLLWGKWLGTLVTVAIGLSPALAAALFWLAAGREAAWDVDLTLRLALWLGLHAVVFATCAAIGVATSARSRSSHEALARVVGVWVLLWIVTPRVLPAVATALYPLPARAAFDAEIETRVRELGDSHNPDDPKFASLETDVLRRYGVTRVEDLPFNYAGFVNREAESRSSQAYAEHVAALQQRYARQARVAQVAGLFSPYIAARLTSMVLAGSDNAHADRFERQAETYRYNLVQRMNELHMNEVTSSRDRYGAVVNGAPTRQRIDREFFASVPDFSPERPRIIDVVIGDPLGVFTPLVSLAAALLWVVRRGAGGVAVA